VAQAALLPAGATATLLTSISGGFTEGPLYDAANNRVLFTDLRTNNQPSNPKTIQSWNLATKVRTTVVANSNAANGLYFDAGGHVVSADRTSRQISQRSLGNLSTVETVLASGWNAPAGFTPFIGPNDLVIDSAGGIYFTDPQYGDNTGTSSLAEAVYYRSAAGAVSRLLTGFSHPNGVVLSPDERTLYLAIEGEKRIMAYDVTAPGVLANQREFAKTNVPPLGAASDNNGPDGLTVDPAGNVYAATRFSVMAWNPSGERILSLAVAMDPTNVELGGRNRKTLFITAGNSLYSVGLNVVPKLPGDFDYDGDVDGDDLAVWQADADAWSHGNGPTGAELNADANGDGYADGFDLLAWQRNLTPAPAAAVVPEPSGAWLAMGASLVVPAGRRRRLA
jgi:gluconolactonase